MRRRAVLGLIAGGALALRAGAAGDAGAVWRGRFDWHDPRPGFGGISAIDLAAGGRGFTALTDRGQFLTGRLVRDGAGRVAAVEEVAFFPMRDPEGQPLRRERADAEGLAVAPDGRLYVSFEGRGGGRVWSYADVHAPAEPLPRHDDFRRMEPNGALEALAIDAAGALHTLPEFPWGGVYPLYRFRAGQGWRRVAALPAPDDFRAVSADFGPDGRFYLLERRFRLPLRFAARLRRFRPGDWGAGEVLLETPLRQHDNLEALSVRRDTWGRLRATMVSDDNFLPFQRTEIVEYLLPD